MIMSYVGWTLWAAIQARISPIDYDFWGWAVERWGRAEAKLSSPDFDIWLQDVQRSDRLPMSAAHPGAGRVDKDVRGDGS